MAVPVSADEGSRDERGRENAEAGERNDDMCVHVATLAPSKAPWNLSRSKANNSMRKSAKMLEIPSNSALQAHSGTVSGRFPAW
jgi:hypothetical protein